MAVKLALPFLFDAVVAQFAADATICPQAFGWREPAKKLTATPRISWVPGDDGKLGDLGPAMQPGRTDPGRPLATLHELFTVTIEGGVDASAPENELRHYELTRLLFDAWYRAVYLVAHGTVAVVSAEWIDDRKERRHGAALKVVCTVQAMIPDEAPAIGATDAVAAIATSVLDVTENVSSAPAAADAASTAPLTLSGLQTVDGVELEADARVLVKDQADPIANGLYVAKTGAWVRTADVLVSGVQIFVGNRGAALGSTTWQLTTLPPIVLGTTALVFVRT